MRHILVVDDNPINLTLAEAALGEACVAACGEACKVTLIASPTQALKFLARFRPDLMLLDVRMPGMDGFELLRQARLIPGLQGVPVIFLTAAEDPETAALIREAGADMLLKPLNPAALTEHLTAFL